MKKSKEITAFDALGNEIIINEVYCYSQRTQGRVTVVIGKVVKISDLNKVTLDIIKRGYAIYEDNIKTDKRHEKKNVSVYSNTLFKMNIQEINWEE